MGYTMKSWSNSDVPPPSASVPEKRLLAAVLQRAITDYLTGDKELKEGAYAWLMEEEEGESPISFLFICEALDLDADGLKRAILAQAASACAAFVNNNLVVAGSEKVHAQAGAL